MPTPLGLLRAAVSTNKRRTVAHGVDLDFSVILADGVGPRIIAMVNGALEKSLHAGAPAPLDIIIDVPPPITMQGYPSVFPRSLIRNAFADVSYLLSALCPSNSVHVYNLCIEEGWQYVAGLGPSVVAVHNLPLWDGQVRVQRLSVSLSTLQITIPSGISLSMLITMTTTGQLPGPF